MKGTLPLSAAALLVLLATGGVAAQAAPSDTLRLSDALQAALATNPMLQAAQLSAVAAAERVGPAGALPDPQLQFGLMNRMVSEFGSTMDPMTMNQVQLMQMLPWPGKLGNARRATARPPPRRTPTSKPACSRQTFGWRTTRRPSQIARWR